MFDIGAHANHVNIKGFKEEQIICQISDGLFGQADHHAGAHLITCFTQVFQSFDALFESMKRVFGMDLVIKLLVCRFDA